jgi:hypothetical protein
MIDNITMIGNASPKLSKLDIFKIVSPGFD